MFAPKRRLYELLSPQPKRLPIRRHDTNRNTRTNGAGGSESASP